MDSDEREIYYYLKSWKDSYLSSHEIGRRAGGKRRHRQEPNWAKPVLVRMAKKGIVETDAAGYYRLKPIEVKGRKAKRWVSPQVEKILKDSGKEFHEITMDEAEMDKFYEKL